MGLWLTLSACGGGGGDGTALSNTSGGSSPTGGIAVALDISPDNPAINSGDTLQLTATGIFDDGSTADFTESVLWRTLNPETAVVSATGLVTGAGVGVAVIAANHPTGVGASTSVQVSGFSIQGTLSAASGTLADGDVNDPLAPYAPNDSLQQAQDLPNPSTAGGYVNRPGSGAIGRSFSTGDTSDFYRVSLVANQTIVLNVADADSGPGNDLDLFVYSDDGSVDLNAPDFASIGANSSESVTPPVDGTFFVEVFANSGASNYSLTIGQTVLTISPSLNMNQEFVPGEILTRFKGSHATDPLNFSGFFRGLGRRIKSGPAGDISLLSIADPLQRAQIFDTLKLKWLAKHRLKDMYRHDVRQRLKWETLQVIKLLRKRTDIFYAEPNYIRSASLLPNDHFYNFQWHYPLINLPQAWDQTTGSPNVNVAVIDTGVLLDHPDLQGKFVSGFDFISNSANALDGDGIDPNPDDPGDGRNPDGSSSFHGTHIAGTIAAATNNSPGVAGVGWNTKIMPLRALGGGGGTDVDIAQSIRFAAGLTNDSGTFPSLPAAVINMSLGASAFSNTLCDAVAAARAAGSIIVASAGNSGTTELFYPAACPGSVSVSAVDIDKQLASYSSFGPTIDVSAPGGDIGDTNGDGYPDFVLSTGGSDSAGPIEFVYTFAAGTSMAASHVSGVIALMEAVAGTTGNDITPDEFDALLAGGDLTEDRGAAGRDDIFGYGLIDAAKAVLAAKGAAATDPLPVATPASLNFGTVSTADQVTITNSGMGSLAVTDVTINPASAQNWLSITADTVDTSGLGTYLVSVNRSNVADNTYRATIVISTSAGPVNVPVLMQKLTNGLTDNAGFHYILAVDTTTSEIVATTTAEAINGQYSYELIDVPAGEYLIFAGSNFDNDDTICDDGEACGAYLSLDQPTPVVVTSNRNNIDFATGFNPTVNPGALTGLQLSPPAGRWPNLN
jgi:serine protease